MTNMTVKAITETHAKVQQQVDNLLKRRELLEERERALIDWLDENNNRVASLNPSNPLAEKEIEKYMDIETRLEELIEECEDIEIYLKMYLPEFYSED